MKIGIIGLGTVGKANKFGFEKIGHHVLEHDIKFNTKIKELLVSEIIFICVPTPSKLDGSCDTSIVESVLNELANLNFKGVTCIRSSTEPGFTEQMIKKYKNKKICFVPEFLRERCAKKDFLYNHNLLAVGTHDKKVFNIIKRAHGKIPKKIFKLKPTEAEILKYYINVYASMRVTFANIFFEIAKKFKCSYNNILKSYIQTGRGSPKMYLKINKNLRGYAGICLPKDTIAIISLIKKLKLNFDLIKSIDSDNKKFKKTVFKGMRVG